MKKVLGLFVFIALYGFLSFSISFSQAPLPSKTPQIEQQNKTDPAKGTALEKKENNGKDANCDPKKDIMLNISIPFIGRCIKKDGNANAANDSKGNTTAGNVFPKLIGGMTRLVMTAIYIIGFLLILVGGFMIAASGIDSDLKSKGKSLIIMSISGMILLGATGIILNFINPDFFGTES